MPRGVKGSGPYSKFNEDGSPKAAKRTRKATAKKATTRAARKTTTRKTTAKRTRRPANGHTDLGQLVNVSISADGTLLLEGRDGKISKATLVRPSILLDLEQDAHAAAQEYLEDRDVVFG